MDIQKLKSVIQAANPGIMALEFGCEVEYERKRGVYLEKIPGFADCFKLYKDFKTTGMKVVTNPKLKILGRPIRLADVVETFSQQYSLESNDFLKEKLWLIWCNWETENDNLDNQNDDCKKFLSDLLT